LKNFQLEFNLIQRQNWKINFFSSCSSS